jgi:hypothetical protein
LLGKWYKTEALSFNLHIERAIIADSPAELFDEEAFEVEFLYTVAYSLGVDIHGLWVTFFFLEQAK